MKLKSYNLMFYKKSDREVGTFPASKMANFLSNRIWSGIETTAYNNSDRKILEIQPNTANVKVLRQLIGQKI